MHPRALCLLVLCASAQLISFGELVDRVAAEGELTVEPRGRVPEEGRDPAVALGDGRALLVWSGGNKTLFARLATDGTLLEPQGLPVFDEASPVSVIWMDDVWWIARAKPSAEQIEIATVSKDAEVTSRLTLDTTGFRPQHPARLERGPEQVLLLYRALSTVDENTTMQAMRVTPDLRPLDPLPISLPVIGWRPGPSYLLGDDRPPTATWTQDRFLVAWKEGKSDTAVAVLGSISADGVPSSTRKVLGRVENGPVLMSQSGGTIGVFWTSPTESGYELVATRFLANGVQVDPEPISAPGQPTCPSAVVPVDGGWSIISDSFNAWPFEAPYQLFVPTDFVGQAPDFSGCSHHSFRDAVVTKDGALLMASAVEWPFGHADIVGDPDRDGGTWIQAIRVAYRPKGANFIVPEVAMVRSQQIEPTFSGGADRWFVAWQEFDQNDGYVVYGTMVRPDGTLTPTASAPLSPGGELWGGERPTVAWNGSYFLLAWAAYFPGDDSYSSPAHDVVGMLFDMEGRALLPEPVKLATGGTNVSPLAFVKNGRFVVRPYEKMQSDGVWVDVVSSGELSVTPVDGGETSHAVPEPPCAVEGKTLEVTETRPAGEPIDPGGVIGNARVVMRVVDAPADAPACPVTGPASPDAGVHTFEPPPDAGSGEPTPKTRTHSRGGCEMAPQRSHTELWLWAAGLFVGWTLRRRSTAQVPPCEPR